MLYHEAIPSLSVTTVTVTEAVTTLFGDERLAVFRLFLTTRDFLKIIGANK